jgi:hypothetical protein
MTTTTNTAPVDLQPVELLACWEALELGEPPFLLRLRSPSGTEAIRRETAQQLRAAMTRLTERGLSDGARPSAALAEWLQVIARSSYQLDIRFTGPAGRPVLGFGAVAGEHSVAAISNDGAGPQRLVAMDSSRLPGALISLLGPIRPGTVSPVNIPAEVLDQACASAPDGSAWAMADQLRERGIPGQDASSLARMCSGVSFGGQLGATARFGGPARRGPWVIGFIRNETGCFHQLRRDGSVTMGPTDANRLHRLWHDLIDHIHQLAAHLVSE